MNIQISEKNRELDEMQLSRNKIKESLLKNRDPEEQEKLEFLLKRL